VYGDGPAFAEWLEAKELLLIFQSGNFFK
jgi:hypothetical protein